MLVLEFALTEKEFCDFNYYVSWQAPWKKAFRRSYYMRSISSFGILAAAFFLFVDEDKMGLPVIVGVVTGFVTMAILLPRNMRSIMDKQVKQIIRESGPESILPPTMLTITANGILDKTLHAETRYSWSAFRRKLMVNNCYYLSINSRQAVIIPKSAFRSAAEEQEFQAILAEHLPLTAELNAQEHVF